MSDFTAAVKLSRALNTAGFTVFLRADASDLADLFCLLGTYGDVVDIGI